MISTAQQQELLDILTFIKTAERLKATLRSAYNSEGSQESTAEHTWRITLLAFALEKYYPEINFSKLIKMLIIHDLGEIINGDIPAIYQNAVVDKNDEERNDFLEVIEPLSVGLQAELLSLFDEYNAVKTPEAKLAKALDKLETLLQHVQGKNPDDFDYAFNLTYGKDYTESDAITSFLRSIIDQQTQQRHDDQQQKRTSEN
ncbi:MAG: HD domain-containing protein [Cyclobacteriaceae bacterium]